MSVSAIIPHRPGARHDREESDTNGRLRTLAKRFRFWEDFMSDIEDAIARDRTLCTRSIKYHTQRRTDDEEHFYLDMSKANYLTMLYRKTGDWEQMSQENKTTLSKDGRNFRGLWLQVELQMKKKDYQATEAAFRKLEEVSRDEFVMLVAQAEVALNYPDFGPRYYQKSVQLLEEVLRILGDRPELMQQMPDSMLIKWKYDLAHTYSKAMNKGNTSTYWRGQAPSRVWIFRRIKELLLEVIKSNDRFYAPKAWTDIADAFKKYEEKADRKKMMETLPDNMTPDDCFRKAFETGPDDSYVLERCGRHFRQRATDIGGFLKAIKFFEKCVRIDPTRDVAYHQMGLAHRSIWIDDEHHPPVWLHMNRTKKHGEKKSMQGPKRRPCKQTNANGHEKQVKHHETVRPDVVARDKVDSARSITKPSTNDRPTSSVSEDASESIICQRYDDGNQSVDRESNAKRDENALSIDKETEQMEIVYHRYHNGDEAVAAESLLAKHRKRDDSASSVRTETRKGIETRQKDDYGAGARGKHRKGNQTIPSKFPKHENEVPKHFNRRPDYHDQLRVSNPIARNKTHSNLMAARRCFEKANEIRGGACGKYLIDLARTYISTGDLRKARELFEKADNSSMNDSDGALLFEQWGLLGKSENTSIENVMNLFRTSIKCSAAAYERSKVAFNELKDTLSRQLDEDPTSEILMKELLLLRTTIQDGQKAEQLLKKMTSEQSLVLMWELVDMFHRRNRPEDAKAAFTYLEVLAKANKLRSTDSPGSRTLSDDEVKEIFSKRSKQVLETAQRRLRTTKDSKSTLASAYRWLVLLSMNTEPAADQEFEEALKIRLFAPSDESPEVQKVKDILVNVIDADIYEIFSFWSDTFKPGRPFDDEILRLSKGAECGVAVMQSSDTTYDEEQRMSHSLKTILGNAAYRPKRFCRAVSSTSPKVVDKTLDLVSEWNLDAVNPSVGIDAPIGLAIDLLGTLFLK